MPGGWPVETELLVQWGEMDAFQHVNNTVYLRWFETARIAYFLKVGLPTGASGGVGPILARATVNFQKPVVFPDTVISRARISRVGTTSFTMEYQAESVSKGVVADGEGVVVMFDYAQQQKVPIDDALRVRIAQLEKEAHAEQQ